MFHERFGAMQAEAAESRKRREEETREAFRALLRVQRVDGHSRFVCDVTLKHSLFLISVII